MPNYVPGLEGWERGQRGGALASQTGLNNVRGVLAIDQARREAEMQRLMQPLQAQLMQAKLGALANPPPKEFTLGPGQSRFKEGEAGPYASAPFKPEGAQSNLGKAFEDFKAGRITKADYDALVQRTTTHAPGTTVDVRVPLTVGNKAVDTKFGATYEEFITGGFADTQKQLDQLRQVSIALEKAEPGTLTGTLVGNMPDTLRAATAPKSLDAQNLVEEVVQRNLRLILGAQFTEKEGERLISRAYNPKLDEKTNKQRVDRLIKQISDAAQAKLDASRYFMANGTLQGWKGRLWTMNDFNPEGTQQSAPTPGRRATDAPSGVDPKLWSVMTPEEKALFQ